MMLLIHIAIALFSLAYITFMYFAPSNTKLIYSYTTIALTMASGSYLIVATGSRILQSCLTGLGYLGVALWGIAATKHKLAKESSSNQR